MRAVQLAEPKQFRFVDVPEPGAPGPGEAVVRVHCVGICGTDYGGYLGKMPFFSYPRIPGHELGVEVVAVGSGVENVQPGDRCCVEPYINCQECYSCTRGHTNCCETHQTLGVHCDGGLQPFYSVPARKLHLAMKPVVLAKCLGRNAGNRLSCRRPSCSQAGRYSVGNRSGPHWSHRCRVRQASRRADDRHGHERVETRVCPRLDEGARHGCV